MRVERPAHKRANEIKTGYWSAETKEAVVQRPAAFEDEEERRTLRPRTIFEQITASPEILGAALARLNVVDAPWDKAFQEMFCDGCPYEDCPRVCPHQEERNNPTWWLGLEGT